MGPVLEPNKNAQRMSLLSHILRKPIYIFVYRTVKASCAFLIGSPGTCQHRRNGPRKKDRYIQEFELEYVL